MSLLKRAGHHANQGALCCSAARCAGAKWRRSRKRHEADRASASTASAQAERTAACAPPPLPRPAACASTCRTAWLRSRGGSDRRASLGCQQMTARLRGMARTGQGAQAADASRGGWCRGTPLRLAHDARSNPASGTPCWCWRARTEPIATACSSRRPARHARLGAAARPHHVRRLLARLAGR